jgi:hypothetical protein
VCVCERERARERERQRVGGRVCARWVGLHVIAEKMKVYSYLLVVKNPY